MDSAAPRFSAVGAGDWATIERLAAEASTLRGAP